MNIDHYTYRVTWSPEDNELDPSDSVISAEIIEPAETVETEATSISTAITEIPAEPALSVAPANDNNKEGLA